MSSKFKYFKIRLASPEEILSWSHGEVKNHETINYRTQKPEPDGLFCEKIFGPTKDYKCACGKARHDAEKGTVCEKCGVEITKKEVRRERMGHIKLASPVVHTWFLKNSPSRIATLLDIKAKSLEEVVYLASYIVIDPGKSDTSKRQIISEAEYSRYKENYGRAFIALTGAEAVKKLLQDIDLEKEDRILRKELHSSTKQKREKIIKRLEVVEAFINSENKPEWMVLDVLPVIPPDLRPMVQLTGGRFATTDLNDLYRRIINRNNRLKRQYEQNAPHLITKNEKRMLQEAVDALIDNSKRGKKAAVEKARPLKSLSDLLRGKQGRFRQNLLGKRVDYSGRSVIIVGPNLQMHQCGIPKEMALTLFQPFVSRELIKQGCGSAQAKKLVDNKDDQVWGVLEEVIREHPILLNRAPSLHRLSIQAFEPVLVEGKAIRLHPLVCTAFNADFDGDQMAVHLPLSHEAQAEARLLMLASNNILNPKDGKPVVTPSQDMVLGNYYLTLEYRYEPNQEDKELRHLEELHEGKFFTNYDEAYLAYKNQVITLHTRIFIDPKSLSALKFQDIDTRGKYLFTTLGKLIFNNILPEEFPYINEPTENNLAVRCPSKYFLSIKEGQKVENFLARPSVRPFNKKYLGKIIAQVFKNYQVTETSKMLDRLKNLGFKYSTLSGITISATDIEIYSHKQDRLVLAEKVIDEVTEMYDLGACTLEERKKRVAKEWADARSEMEAGLWKELEVHPTNHIYMMADSGSRGSRSNFSQLAGMRGLMNDTAGNVIEVPVKANFREGLSVSEFFISTHGARKGSTDTALKTAQSGYLTRRLVDVAQDVVITETDCGTDRGVVLSAIVGEDGKVAMDLRERILGRYTASPIINPITGEVIVGKNEIITEDMADSVELAGVTEAKIRTNLTCQAKHGVCKHCYGRNLATNKKVEVGEAVGVIAAQSIGEPGTQLTMRTFHDGGVASAGDITQGLPRVQELIEIRNPKGRAILSEVDGEVISITKTKLGNVIAIQTAELDKNDNPVIVKYTADATSELKVDTDDNRFVHRGDRLMAGALFPRDLLKIEDALAAQNYIVEEVQKVYRSQGVEISDKHIEIICRQMMKKVKVITEGDTRLLPGKTVTRNEFDKAVKYALDTNGELPTAQPVLLGITKAALGSPSFLSAASFQETTKVLTDAAIKSKADKLYGLKENVIVGGLIPAGTGILQEESFEYEGRPVEIDEVDDYSNLSAVDPSIAEVNETEIKTSVSEELVTETISEDDIIGKVDDSAYSFDDDIEDDIIG